MTRLACSAHNCVNYINGMCSALTIEVDGESAENKQETCSYNVGMICTSTDIQVFGPEATTSTSTECETFYKK